MHSGTSPRRPNALSRRSTKISWSIVSKVADRSNRQRKVTSPRSAARPSRNIAVTNHCGVAAIITKRLKSKVIRSVSKVTSFEILCFSVTNCSNTVIILLVYRTGPVTDMFFSELQSYLETIALYKCHIIISGDFNIHVERQNDNHAIRLNEILRNFDCTQHVPHSMTHRDGGTLDLVITKSGEQIEAMSIAPPDVYSDHSLISWCLPFVHQPPITLTREIRMWRKLDKDKFRASLRSSGL